MYAAAPGNISKVLNGMTYRVLILHIHSAITDILQSLEPTHQDEIVIKVFDGAVRERYVLVYNDFVLYAGKSMSCGGCSRSVFASSFG